MEPGTRTINSRMNRRTLLTLAANVGIGLLAGCSAELQKPEQKPQASPSPIIRPTIGTRIGEWTDEETERFANAMQQEPELNDIAFAGSILLDNLKGRPSFSRMSPVFTDDRAKTITISGKLPSVTLATLADNEPRVIIPNRNLADRAVTDIEAAPSLKVSNFQFDEAHMNGLPDYLMHFFMAKNIHTVAAVDEFTTFALEYYKQAYDFPKDPKTVTAMRTVMMSTRLKGIPASVFIETWSSFLMVPNFAKAVDMGKITPTDLDRNDVRVFPLARDHFMKEGILVRDGNKSYKWDKTRDEIYAEWAFLTEAINASQQKNQLPPAQKV